MSNSQDLKKTLEMLKILLGEPRIKASDLRKKLGMSEDSFLSLTCALDYSGIIKTEKDMVRMSAQWYSLLFEPLLVHGGTEQLVDEIVNGDSQFTRDSLSIPAILVPLLLMRSIIPYFGLVLRDIEKTEELGIDDRKKEFLYDFFSPFNFDYKKASEKWEQLHFSSDEFYSLWFLVNARLPAIIRVKSRYPTVTAFDKESKLEIEKNKTQQRNAEHIALSVKPKESEVPKQVARLYNLPLNILKAFFEDAERDRVRIIRKDEDYPTDSLTRLLGVNANLEKILEHLSKNGESRGQITIVVYKNVLEWQYFDERGNVPPLFLTNEGIYGNGNDLKRYSEQKVKRQVKYLSQLIERGR